LDIVEVARVLVKAVRVLVEALKLLVLFMIVLSKTVKVVLTNRLEDSSLYI
jgi:hypothetical protein